MKRRIHLLGIIASIALPINAYAYMCPSGTQDSGTGKTYIVKYLKWSDDSEWNLCLNLTYPEKNNVRDSYGHIGSFDASYQCGNIRTHPRLPISSNGFEIIDRLGNIVNFGGGGDFATRDGKESCTDQGAVVVCTKKYTTTGTLSAYNVSKILHMAEVATHISECRKIAF